MEFAVVKFTKEDDAIGVIPLTWVKEMSDSEERIMASSYYPPSKLKNVERLARKKVTPRIDWDLVETEIIHQYKTYDEARKKLPKAAVTSNLSSDDGEEELKRKRRPKNFLFPGEDIQEEDDSDDDPSPPRKHTSFPEYPSLSSFPPQPDYIKEHPILSSQEVLNDSNFTPPENRCPLTPLARPLFLTSPALPSTILTQNHPSTHQSDSESYTPRPQLLTHINTQHTTPSTSTNDCKNENCNRLFVVVGQLQETVADLTDVVKRLNEKINEHFNVNTRQERTDEKSYEVLGKIPVQSLEEMEELEKMMEKPQFKKQLFKVLTSVGGKDIKTMVYNCLRRLMSYNIAVEYSYSGNTARNKEKTKKIAFSKTNACNITHQAVRQVYPAATEDVVKNFIGKWLQQAKYRLVRKCSEVGVFSNENEEEEG